MWEESKVPSIIVMEEEKYHALNHCSYSFLSKLSQLGYRAFLTVGKKGKALSLGSFIDCYILTPEELEQRYTPVQKHYTATKKVLVDFILENNSVIKTKEDLFKLSRELGLWAKWKEETVMKEFDADFLKYIADVLANRDKIQYSEDDLELANICRNAMWQSHLTEHLFNPEEYGIEVKFQIKGIFELEGIHMKFMVDILVIDHKKKEISIYDLKTGEEDLDSFEKSFLKYRYDIQHYVYTEGVEAISAELGCGGYKINPLEFIYLSKKTPEIPVIYKVPTTLNILEGYTTKHGYEIVGVRQLIDDYKFYNGGFQVPRRVAEGNGIVTLDI